MKGPEFDEKAGFNGGPGLMRRRDLIGEMGVGYAIGAV